MSTADRARPPAAGVAFEPWGHGAVSAEAARDYASLVDVSSLDQQAIARCLAEFPVECKVRGFFFEGLLEVVRHQMPRQDCSALARRASVSERVVAFKHYPHRDFYKLFFLAARTMYPRVSLAVGMRKTAQTFFPIFRNSMLGRTMAALMGSEPQTILPRLAEAYNLSVAWNEHEVRVLGPREILWQCKVEASTWYPEIFTGIVEGAVPNGEARLRITGDRVMQDRGTHRYAFTIRW